MGFLTQYGKPKTVVNDEEVVRDDFDRRAPFWEFRARSYSDYLPFTKYREEIDKHLEALFRGDIDDGNGDTLDALIIDMAQQAKRFMEKQRTDHQDIIMSLDIRSISDKQAFLDQREKYEKTLEENLFEQSKYEEMISKHEFIMRRKDS